MAMTSIPGNDLLSVVTQELPQSSVAASILSLTKTSLSPAIFNHSIRVYLFSKWLATQQKQAVDLELLFAACALHDMGTCDACNGEQRFEVEGADAAKAHLIAAGVSEADAHKVWIAIALHTSAGIAERIDPFTRLVRMGVLMDFSAATRTSVGADDYGIAIEEMLPRLEIEEVLANAVVDQAKGGQAVPNKTCYPSTKKHPAGSWPGMLLRAHLENPGHKGRNPAF